MANYVSKGYTAPTGVDSREDVRQWQMRLGVTVDGIWGKNTQAAYQQWQRSIRNSNAGTNPVAPLSTGASKSTQSGASYSAGKAKQQTTVQQKNTYSTSGSWRERMGHAVSKTTGSKTAADTLPALKWNSAGLGVGGIGAQLAAARGATQQNTAMKKTVPKPQYEWNMHGMGADGIGAKVNADTIAAAQQQQAEKQERTRQQQLNQNQVFLDRMGERPASMTPDATDFDLRREYAQGVISGNIPDMPDWMQAAIEDWEISPAATLSSWPQGVPQVSVDGPVEEKGNLPRSANPYFEMPDDNRLLYDREYQNRVAQSVMQNATWVTPPEEWELTSEHKKSMKRYYNHYWDAMERTKAEDWLSPDPLEKEAAACLIIINELQSQINAQYKNGLPVAVDRIGLGQALRAAYEEYANIPVLLTEETLRNPYAMQYADELSTRILLDREDERNNNQAIRELRKEAELCAKQGDMAGYVWSTQVLGALTAKTKFDTAGWMVMNDLLLNFPERSRNKQYENSTITNVQLNHMATMEARRKSNPQLTQAMDTVLTIADVVGNRAKAFEIIDLIKNNNVKGAMKELGKELGEIGVKWYNKNNHRY